jgi:pyruvate/2-oxoglutarate dehydrogenase complex dihydrolipoamide acyltransferase (E2) component
VPDITFNLPDLGEGLLDATVLEWLIAPGDFVERGAAMVEIETTKSTVELPSPRTGVIAAVHVEEGGVAEVGSPLVSFAVDDDQAGIVGTVPTDRSPARRIRLTIPED